jgi:hypothetical protein
MSEFGDRMRAQRELLQVVNATAWPEELFGLSNQAIDRWSDRSGITRESEVVTLLRSASEHMGFLANRSQMQITEDYGRVWQEFRDLTGEIQEAISCIHGHPRRWPSRARIGADPTP